jgi:hypothetical protein
MSGGHFDYAQYKIGEIVEEIEKQHAYRSKPRFSQWGNIEPYPDTVLNELLKGAEILKKAYVYAQRIDYLFSGDDGEESFLTRLKEELEQL